MSDNETLPPSWVCATGNELFRVVTSGSRGWAQYYADEGALFLRMGNLDHNTTALDLSARQHVQPPQNAEGSRTLVQRNDILVSITAELGMVAVVPDGLGEAYINQHLALARPAIEETAKYIAWFLASERHGKRQLTELRRGATKAGLGLDDVRAARVPLPPLAEQQRIVSAIEEQFTRLDAGVAALKRAQAALKRYRATVLKAAVEGTLTASWRAQHPDVRPASELLADILAERRARWETDLRAKGKDPARTRYDEPQSPQTEGLPELPQGWVWATFTQVSQRVTVGHVGSMKDEYVEDGVPFLRGQNVRPNYFDPNGLKYVSRAFHDQLAKSKLRPGDILVVRSGAVGTACVLPDAVPEANCSDLVIVQQPLLINAQFAAYYMNSSAQDTVRAQKVGIALEHFNTQSLAALPLPLPPLREQEQIVEEVARRLSVVDALELTIGANLKRAERLRQAILERAFTGRLVPQDASDEPASALLERVRREQANDVVARPHVDEAGMQQMGARQVQLW